MSVVLLKILAVAVVCGVGAIWWPWKSFATLIEETEAVKVTRIRL